MFCIHWACICSSFSAMSRDRGFWAGASMRAMVFSLSRWSKVASTWVPGAWSYVFRLFEFWKCFWPFLFLLFFSFCCSD